MRCTDKIRLSIINKVLIAMIVLPIIALLCIVWWPYNPLTIYSATVINSPVIAGSPVYMKLDFFKHVPKPTTIITQLINERNILYSPVISNLPVGRDTKVIPISTSTGDMPGEYYVRRTYTYKYFSFWEVPVVAESQRFQVVKGCDDTKGPEGEKGDTGKQGPAGPRGKIGLFGKADIYDY